jgi:hypothetical protein
MACTCCTEQMVLECIDQSHKKFVEKLYLCQCGHWRITKDKR